MTDVVLSLRNVGRSFVQGGETIEVLKGITLDVRRGELVALLGASGAGKSTLLQAAGLLESGFTGEILIEGTACHTLSAPQRTELRRTKLGFVYQFHHLLPDFSALENVALPRQVLGDGPAQATERARVVLTELGLGHRLTHRPAQLSGGEQQRVAVARALVNEPVLILADEPTGNLDETTGRKVLTEFVRLARARGSAALVATHNRDLAEAMDRVVMLRGGLIAGEASGPGVRLL
jgi:lipoprotein-releasing system ATP-binding protein